VPTDADAEAPASLKSCACISAIPMSGSASISPSRWSPRVGVERLSPAWPRSAHPHDPALPTMAILTATPKNRSGRSRPG
jgi:hypothetical protein